MNPLISATELSTRLPQADQLNELNELNQLALFDCRHDLMNPAWGRAAYAQGHIPGAQFVSLDDDLSAAKSGSNGRHPLPSVATMSELFSRLGIDKHTEVVCYDQGSGMFVGRMWWMLRYLGHGKVRVLDGGFAAWQGLHLPCHTTSHPRPAAHFDAQPQASMLCGVDEVLSHLGTGSQLIVDARAPARYRGDEEPIDPRAGHIPGAVNRPFASNFTPEGLFKPPEQLHREWMALLMQRPLEQVVNQCGSGVSACANMLALEIAGLPGSKLYAGSWSEWSQDLGRPIAVGV